MKAVIKEKYPKGIHSLFQPSRPVLVTTKNIDGTLNVAPFSWCTPVSASPLILALSLYSFPVKKHSLLNIEREEEFGVNLPQLDQASLLVKASFDYPDGISKFNELGFTEEAPVSMHTGLIQECRVNFECQLMKTETVGDHTLILATVEAIHSNEEVFERHMLNLEKSSPCLHMRRFVNDNEETHVFLTGLSTLEVKESYPNSL